MDDAVLLDGLDRDLRAANVMVFRLGQGDGRGTQFALVKAEHSITEFFLSEAEYSSTPIHFSPKVPASDLFPFKLLGTITETGAVNLAIASGLLGHALRCDEPSPRVSPATGASTYTFDVWPHRRLTDLCWQHVQGQVEIDAIYWANRDGMPVLFVIEAKHGQPSALAKTKLAYACSAVATKRVPADIPIVPVYLRSWQQPNGRVRFCITECRVWNRDRAYVTDIEATSTQFLEMALG